jgi:hypothetical protein
MAKGVGKKSSQKSQTHQEWESPLLRTLPANSRMIHDTGCGHVSGQCHGSIGRGGSGKLHQIRLAIIQQPSALAKMRFVRACCHKRQHPPRTTRPKRQRGALRSAWPIGQYRVCRPTGIGLRTLTRRDMLPFAVVVSIFVLVESALSILVRAVQRVRWDWSRTECNNVSHSSQDFPQQYIDFPWSIHVTESLYVTIDAHLAHESWEIKSK